jgi:hypothetical protein
MFGRKRFVAAACLAALVVAILTQGALAPKTGPGAGNLAVASAAVVPTVGLYLDDDTVNISGCPADTTVTVTLGAGGIHRDIKTGASGRALLSIPDLGLVPTPLLYVGERVSLAIGASTLTQPVVQDVDARVDSVRDRVDGTALAPDGTPLAGRAIEITVNDEFGDQVADKTGVVGADGSFSIPAGIDLVPGYFVQTQVWHRAGGLAVGDSTVRSRTIPTSSAVTLSAKKASSAYGAPATLSAKLTIGGVAVTDAGDPDNPLVINLLKSYDGLNWSPAGTLDWDAATKSFAGIRLVTEAVKYRAFFASDGYSDSASGQVSLTSQGALSQPVLSASSPKRNVKFTVTGYLKPYHSGSPLVAYVYRKVGTKWVQFSKTAVPGTAVGTASKHVLALTLATAGQWLVQTYHADKSHLAAWSKGTTFTVK